MMRINLKSTSVHNFLSANLAYQLIKLIRMDSSTAQNTCTITIHICT